MKSARRAQLLRSRSRPSRGGSLSPLRWGFLATIGAGGAVLTILALGSASTIVRYVALALFLALALEPIVRWLVDHHLRRGMAVTVTVLAALVVSVGVLALVVPQVAAQFNLFTRALPGIADDVVRARFVQNLSIDISGIVRQVTAFVTDPAHLLSIGGGLLSVGKGVVDWVTGSTAVAILTLYFSATFPLMTNSLARAVPASKRPTVSALVAEICASVGRYIGGQVALAGLNAVVVLVVLLIAHAPVPLLLAVVAFCGALIPVVGTVVAYAVIVLAMLTVSPAAALVVAAVLLVYAQLEAHLITPRVMSRTMSMPGALVIIAVLAGAAIGGLFGALIAVPVAAAGVLIFERVVVPAQATR
ncbi:AI-2E family transporter [Curtobacterium flaccumfaciens]|uniref:AI-2E family transporter n=1 Tax=Curtobacterium flaccumfaciens TaxID=2035 RepID=UPI001E4CBCF4|nr:AI-2E family transporter [Curtobacterium allii]MCE0459481.1 AI-2E family transporter [Curtobacterium allii]